MTEEKARLMKIRADLSKIVRERAKESGLKPPHVGGPRPSPIMQPLPPQEFMPATRPPVPPTTFRSMNPVLGPEGIRPIREPVTVLPKPVTNPLLNFGKQTPVGRPSPPPYEQMGIPVYYQKSIPHAPKGSPQFNNAYNNAVRWMNRQIEAGKLSPNCQIAVQGDGRRTYFTVTEPVGRY